MKRTATTRHTERHGHLTVPHLTGHLLIPRGNGRHRAGRPQSLPDLCARLMPDPHGPATVPPVPPGMRPELAR